MKKTIERILELQPYFDKRNTPEMAERGLLIRSDLKNRIQAHASGLAKNLQLPLEDIKVEGRDGTGNKTEIPWTRIASTSLSPSTTAGWYVVYLFKADGSGVYLALSHGSTILEDGDFKPRTENETTALMHWARQRVGHLIDALPNVHHSIELGGRTKLSDAYKRTTIAAFYYPRHAIPLESKLLLDLNNFASILGLLYEAQILGQSPGSLSPEQKAISDAIRPLRSGQGFLLNASERKAVENRAMHLADQYLRDLEYIVKDVSSKQSYDFHATKKEDGSELFVEVKGTTAGPSSVILTANEVQLMQERAPATALILVYGICLDRSGKEPTANGGTLIAIQPWHIDDQALKPLSYTYKVPFPHA
jgi:hypothetical protein